MNINPLHINTFYFELPLYYPIKIENDNHKDFITLLEYKGVVNYYTPNLKENTTYVLSPCGHNGGEYFERYGGIEPFKFTCARTGEVFYLYVNYNKRTNIFQKIGQFPSIATFHISQIKKYDKILNKVC